MHVHVGSCATAHVGGQRTTFRNQFSPLTVSPRDGPRAARLVWQVTLPTEPAMGISVL